MLKIIIALDFAALLLMITTREPQIRGKPQKITDNVKNTVHK